MPTIKRSLTRPEKLDHLARAKQMRAEGVDLQIREEWLEAAHSLEMKAAGVDVEIPHRRLEKSRSLDIFVAGGPVSFIFDMPGGGAAFAIWVRLVARRLVILLDWAMTTAWDDQIAPQYFDDRIELWRLGQKGHGLAGGASPPHPDHGAERHLCTHVAFNDGSDRPAQLHSRAVRLQELHLAREPQLRFVRSPPDRCLDDDAAGHYSSPCRATGSPFRHL